MNFLKRASQLADKANPMNMISKAGASIAEKTVDAATNKEARKEMRESFSMKQLIVDSTSGINSTVTGIKDESIEVTLGAIKPVSVLTDKIGITH